MWRGAIQFGLVTIPVRLYLATESRGVSFNMLHAACLNRIQMRTYCPFHDETISRGDTVRGYEYAPGAYVVVTENELESVPLKTVRSIEIELFTQRQPVQRTVRFVKQAYYLEPEPLGRKAFYLLKDVLGEQDLTAICKVVIKDREALAAIDPFGRTMLLTTLHWPDEIRAIDDLDLPAEEPQFKPAERAMAMQLIAAMTAEFDPANYRDDYRDALLQILEAKVAGRETVAVAPTEPASNLVDLMAALEASVRAAVDARTGSAPIPVHALSSEQRASSPGRGRGARTAKHGDPSRVANGSDSAPAPSGGDAQASAAAEPATIHRRKTA